MPCDSIITNTQMTNAERLADAMRAEGQGNVSIGRSGLEVYSDRMRFFRQRPDQGFSTTSDLGTVGKRYAELSARAWAKRAGYSVLSLEDDQMTLINRRR